MSCDIQRMIDKLVSGVNELQREESILGIEKLEKDFISLPHWKREEIGLFYPLEISLAAIGFDLSCEGIGGEKMHILRAVYIGYKGYDTAIA